MTIKGMSKYIDKYEILEELGRGEMGAVYKALHPHFKKYVAIKEIRAELANDAEAQGRFAREAELLARLPPHPNIVTVRDALIWQGQLYLVMDYIEGETLREVVRAGGVDAERGAMIIDQILSGLEAIHQSGVVHRDLKAGNILIDRQGTAHISDFGIAELVGVPSKSVAMATAKYVAPELIESRLGRGGCEQQVDIYAAGVLAYELLLGEKCFCQAFAHVYNGSPNEVARRWLTWHTDMPRTAPSLNEINSGIPKSLAATVARMMAKDVKERYRDASTARQDIAASALGAQLSRNRRDGPSSDEQTMPIDRMRRGGARPPEPPLPQYAPRPEPPEWRERRPSTARRPPALRNLPRWAVWAAGGLALLAVTAFALFAIIPHRAGFSLIIYKAPPGSEVFVNEVRRGVSSSDGAIRVWGLRAGARDVRVTYAGNVLYAGEVKGENGDSKEISAAAGPSPLPKEIYDKGPMVLIPAGDFEMGDDNHSPNERPRHPVPVADYYIDKYEVTNKQYAEFCKDKGRKPPDNPDFDPQYFENNPDSPVVGLSWTDANDYAEWAGKRLPSEQEWEKAASWDPQTRTKRMWPWGDNPAQAQVNLNSNRTMVVGKSAGDKSAYEVYDMAGNAGEWVADFYKPYSNNPAGAAGFDVSNRVTRGSGFNGLVEDARTTSRWDYPPDTRTISKVHYFYVGFRCAKSVKDQRGQ
jgi:formylglycine-generating enzyme required for sulfatase activity/serine/threonine protein kinase